MTAYLETDLHRVTLVNAVGTFLVRGKEYTRSRANNHPGRSRLARGTWRMRLISKLSVLKLEEANQRHCISWIANTHLEGSLL